MTDHTTNALRLAGHFALITTPLGLLAAGSANAAVPLPSQNPGIWQMTFNDEFSGTSVDRSKWNTQWREFDNNGNIFYQPYRFQGVNLDSNLSIVDIPGEPGNRALRIRAADDAPSWSRTPYSTGVINSAEKFSQTYGYFEARVRAPDQFARGTNANFFLFPEADRWPPEIDIFEIYGSGESRRVLQNQHFRRPNGTRGDNQKITTLPGGQRFSDGFRTFGVNWQPDRIDWYIDGQLTHSSTTFIPDEPMVMFLANEITGDWTGNPADGTWPQFYDIDYVRVYELIPEPGAGMALLASAAVLLRRRRNGPQAD